jgi:hypothetical protein
MAAGELTPATTGTPAVPSLVRWELPARRDFREGTSSVPNWSRQGHGRVWRPAGSPEAACRRIALAPGDPLIGYRDDVPAAPAGVLAPLRRARAASPGHTELAGDLRWRGRAVWVYTTSHRRPGAVRRWLRAHGARTRGVINQDAHARKLRHLPPSARPSKHPGAFGIDLHVDDSEGVRMEGARHGFRVVVVAPHDRGWADKVLRAVEAMGTD